MSATESNQPVTLQLRGRRAPSSGAALAPFLFGLLVVCQTDTATTATEPQGEQR